MNSALKSSNIFLLNGMFGLFKSSIGKVGFGSMYVWFVFFGVGLLDLLSLPLCVIF